MALRLELQLSEQLNHGVPLPGFSLRTCLGRQGHQTPLHEMCCRARHMKALAVRLAGGFSARPLLSVPHILADESSCYYHGYVLAEMSVHQTRAYFKKKLGGKLVDNPQ
eukprot:scaffold95574_cov20-Tisochrysis_lutea.AAC.2